MSNYSDQQLLDCLYEIDMLSDRSVSDWETRFIESNLERDTASFSDKQRDTIEKLIERYLE